VKGCPISGGRFRFAKTDFNHKRETDEHQREAHRGPAGHARPGGELQNIGLACKRAGISRSHYYEIEDAFERYGAAGLAPAERRRPRMPNETPAELVTRILETTERYPTRSDVFISQQLKLVGVGVSPAAVRAGGRARG
jgi:hypothetical protein